MPDTNIHAMIVMKRESHGMKKVNYHSEAITIILVTELMIA